MLCAILSWCFSDNFVVTVNLLQMLRQLMYHANIHSLPIDDPVCSLSICCRGRETTAADASKINSLPVDELTFS